MDPFGTPEIGLFGPLFGPQVVHLGEQTSWPVGLPTNQEVSGRGLGPRRRSCPIPRYPGSGTLLNTPLFGPLFGPYLGPIWTPIWTPIWGLFGAYLGPSWTQYGHISIGIMYSTSVLMEWGAVS